MPLIKYSQYLTFPDGLPASNYSTSVRLLGGNVLVPTFIDKAGTTPLANPTTTDVDGLREFYAAPGAFYTDIAGNVFHYAVDATETDPAWPGTFVHTQTTAATQWTVAHHFGVEPSVSVLVDGQVTDADVAHTDEEITVITFGVPAMGTAYLRR